jgi:hypothetical protein
VPKVPVSAHRHRDLDFISTGTGIAVFRLTVSVQRARPGKERIKSAHGRARPRVQLAHQVRHVHCGGAFDDRQHLADVPVGHAASHQLQHLSFAEGQGRAQVLVDQAE